jgi:hypothetical protein
MDSIYKKNDPALPDNNRDFQYMNENGKYVGDEISIKISKKDTLDDVKKKLNDNSPNKPTNTQDIYFAPIDKASIDTEYSSINTIEDLKKSTGVIVFTIAESLGGGRRRRSSTPRKTSSRRSSRSTKRRTTSRKQQKRRRSRRAH